MAFTKGKSGNPNGRPKGTPNRSTRAVRQALEATLSNEIDNLPAMLEQLDPRDRVTALARLLPYILPRMELSEVIEVKPKEEGNLDYSKLSTEELETMYNLIQKAERA